MDAQGNAVLVVDDDEGNRTLAVRMLEFFGVAGAVSVDSGMLALAVMQSTRFDLVIMDGRMPGIDGWETTRLIRLGHGGEHNRAVPVLAWTSEDDPQRRASAAGMDDVLSKPLDFGELRAKLDCWLHRGARG